MPDNDWVNLNDNVLKGNSFSVSIWMKSREKFAKKYGRYLAFGTGQFGSQRVMIGQGAARKLFIALGKQGNILSDDHHINFDEWYHVVLALKGKRFKIYLNGKLIENGTCRYIPSASHINAGSYMDGHNSFWPGALDELRIFNRPLTTSEVYRLYKLNE